LAVENTPRRETRATLEAFYIIAEHVAGPSKVDAEFDINNF
jgi:hypothetical protein